MKKLKVRKMFLILLMMSIFLLILSGKEYATSKMMDDLLVNINSDVVQVLGDGNNISQTGITCSMKTDIKINSEIANNRKYYGTGEELNIILTFSRAIQSKSDDVKLCIQFGEGEEKVIDKPTVDGSYLIFKYKIQSGDNGGLSLTNIAGSVTDSDGKTMPLGLQEKGLHWKNDIIADTKFDNPSSESAIDHGFYFNENVYILENNTIREIKYKDVKILDTSTGGYEEGDEDTVDIINNLIRSKEPNVFFVENVCDIAGNKKNVVYGGPKWYVINNDDYEKDGIIREDEDKDKVFLNEGKQITLLNVNCSEADHNNNIKIGETAVNIDKKEDIVEGYWIQGQYYCIAKYTYTIKEGDNGVIGIMPLDDSTCVLEAPYTYIADTTPPEMSVYSITPKNDTKVYYSLQGNNTNGCNGKKDHAISYDEETCKNATIWAKPGAIFEINYYVQDQNSSCSTGDNQMQQLKFNADKEGLNDLQLNFADFAGNCTYLNLTDYFHLICDNTGPEIKITSNDTYTKNELISFTITPQDVNYENESNVYSGSGVIYNNGEIYRSVNIKDVIVANGTIIRHETTENDLTVEIMPNGDGNVSVYVPSGATEDNVGNKSQASSITKVYSDRTAPVITSVEGIPTDWTKEATISVIANDTGAGGIQYRFGKPNNQGEVSWDASWTEDNTKQITENGKIYIQAKDNVGNESEVKIVEITKIDREVPTISSVDYNAEWTNQDVTVTINASDGESGIGEYSFDGGTSWQASPTKRYTESTTISAANIKVKDNAGNVTTYTGQDIVIQIDKVAPTISGSRVTLSENKKVNIEVTASDEGGSSELQYSIDEGPYQSSNTFENQPILERYLIKVKDQAGNETKSFITLNLTEIDNMGPTITSVVADPSDWTKGDVNVTITANDSDGLGVKEYSFDGGMSWQASPTKRYTESTTISAGNIQVKDNAGNVTTYTGQNIEIKIDKNAPVIKKTEVIKNSNDRTTKINVSAIDEESGDLKYSFNNGDYVSSNEYQVTEAGTYTIAVKDAAGNISYIACTISTDDLDYTEPTINSVDYNAEWTNQDVIVTINARDDSGILEYSFDGGTTWQTLPTKTYTEYTTISAANIKVKDNAGNVTTYAGQDIVIQIDKVAPNVQVSETASNGNIIMRVTANDQPAENHSGIKGFNFFDGNGLIEETTSENEVIYNYEVDKNGTYTIQVVDKAGNETTVQKVITDISDAPIISITNDSDIYVMPTEGNAPKISSKVNVKSDNECTVYYMVNDQSTGVEPTDIKNKNQSIIGNNVIINMIDLGLQNEEEEKTYYLWVYAEDSNNKGSIVTVSQIKVVKSEITFRPNPDTFTNGDVTVKISYGEGLTNNKKVSLNDMLTGYTENITLSENGKVYVEATDKAGNLVYNELEVNWIDKIAPEITFSIQEGNYILNSNTDIADIKNTVKVEEANLDNVNYAWTQSKDEPKEYLYSSELNQADITKQVSGNDVGDWYLYVKATDKAGNVSVEHAGPFSVKLAVAFDTSEKSCIKEIKTKDDVNYIIVTENTTVETLLKNIDTSYNVTIKTKDNESVSGNSILATNQTIEIDGVDVSYIIVVKGDVTRDGRVDISDLVKLNQYTLENESLDQAELFAGDVNGDGKIDIVDLTMIWQLYVK